MFSLSNSCVGILRGTIIHFCYLEIKQSDK